jgi:AAA+ superfamily predicted ATPase
LCKTTKFSLKTPQKAIAKYVKTTISRDINITALKRELGKATEAEQAIKENDLNAALTTINKQNTRKEPPKTKTYSTYRKRR